MVRACQVMPQEHGCGMVARRLRAPPLRVRCSHVQPTTVVGGGGGLHQYQPTAVYRGCIPAFRGARTLLTSRWLPDVSPETKHRWED
jgi:hypothetical protein